MTFVVDASVVLAWHLGDEYWDAAEPLIRRASNEVLVVPGHLQTEVANGLLRAERTGRTNRSAVEAFIETLGLMHFEIAQIEDGAPYARLLPLARDHRLKLFDAGYLDLAMTRGLPLATFDMALADAARGAGVALVEA